MHNYRQIKAQAILAAKAGNWQLAVETNQNLLEYNAKDISALNRLGVAQSQLENKEAAIKTFKQVLELDRHNLIAKKHLEKLKKNNHLHVPTFSKQQFIEEPGKTKVIDLHRLAGKQVLDSLSVGQSCNLIRKKRYISVEVGNQYIGALPEDISFRLCKLIGLGNRYECYIRSINHGGCSVYIREIHRSKRTKHIHSFPPGKFVMRVEDQIDESILLDDDKPNSKKSKTNVA